MRFVLDDGSFYEIPEYEISRGSSFKKGSYSKFPWCEIAWNHATYF